LTTHLSRNENCAQTRSAQSGAVLRGAQDGGTTARGVMGEIITFASAASEVPFGGRIISGMRRGGGPEGIADYLDMKLAQVAW
jgi:acyl-CoA reductase-like NAD-dependent aldehyde dehydrogenase